MARQNPITPARGEDEDSYEFIDIEKEEFDDSDWDMLEDGSQDEGASWDSDSDIVESGCSNSKDLPAESDAGDAVQVFELDAATSTRCPPSSPVISPAHTSSSLPEVQLFNLPPAAVFLPALGPAPAWPTAIQLADEESDALLLPFQSSPICSVATPDSDSESETYTDTDSESETYTETDTDTDIDTDTETDTNTDTEICAVIIATFLNVAVSIVALVGMTVECCLCIKRQS